MVCTAGNSVFVEKHKSAIAYAIGAVLDRNGGSASGLFGPPANGALAGAYDSFKFVYEKKGAW